MDRAASPFPGPFHHGELAAQQRAGEADAAAQNGAMLRDRLPAPSLPWLGRQTLLVVATLDAAGRPWASPWFGPPGFVVAPADDRVSIRLDRLDRAAADPALDHLASDGRIALLAIELETRRRLRIAGEAAIDGGLLHVRVAQAYPNCPKYIHRRTAAAPLGEGADPSPAQSVAGARRFDAESARLVADADTFFVASRGADGWLDVSHRGGPPGFVAIGDDGALAIPDYAGNSMFNTLGNLLADRRAGLAFVDFAGSRTLQVVGRATVSFAGGEAAARAGGTGRSWSFTPESWVRSHGHPRRRLVLIERSPLVPAPPAQDASRPRRPRW